MKDDRFYRNLFVIVATIVVVATLYKVRSLLTPVFSALLVAYIIYPVVLGASRIGIPKAVTITMIFVATAGSLVHIGYKVIPAVNNEVKMLSRPDDYKAEAESKLVNIGRDVSKELQKLGIINETWEDEKIIRESSAWVAEQSSFLLFSVGDFAKKTGQFLMIFFFVLVFALLDGDKFYRTSVQLIPNSFFEPGVYILKKTVDLLGSYLRGLVVENIILGVVSFVLLLVLVFFTSLTVILALVIAFTIAITNVIRIIGPIIGAVIGSLLVLVSSTDIIAMIGIIGVVMIVQFLDNILVLPLVMKEQVEIHPVFCVLGVLMGGMLAGILGMIIAIPVIGSIKVIVTILSVEMKKFSMEPESVPELAR